MLETKAIQRIEEKMAVLEPGTLRHQTLEAAKRFKSSWIELGRMLFSVHREKKFREWGYLTFEAYCAKEIGVRASTAKKLLHSYFFLEKEEPTVLKRLTEEASPATLPSVETVNLLRLLKNRQEVAPGNYQRVRSYALEKGKEPTEIRREIRSILEEANPDPEKARAARHQATLRRMIGTLKAMRAELSAANLVPKKILAEIEQLTKKLEDVL